MTIEIDDTSSVNPDWISRTRELILDPTDFNKWLELVKYTENLNGGVVKSSSSEDKYLLIKTYENLLTQFPCLEKFWCDLGHWYFKLGYTEECVASFEKLLQVLPYSIIIWMDYLEILIFQKSGQVEHLIHHFEEARLKIGLHYYSDKFYDLYLTFLLKNEQFTKYYSLLRRVLEIPLYQYSKYFHKWFQLIEEADLKTISYIITPKDLQSKFQHSTADLQNPKLLQDLRTKLKKLFIDLYITTQYHSYQFYQFEKNFIVQFHQPLITPSSTELQTWIDYFIFLETLLLNHSNTKDKLNYKIQLHYIITLYERCLLVNCNESKIWLKYINFQIAIKNIPLAIETCKRSFKFLPVDLELNFKLIDVLNCGGNYNEAHSIALKLYKFYPQNISVFVKLLICEKNIHKQKTDDHLISLSTKKLASSSLDPIFDYIFLEIQDFKIISIDKIKKFITSFKDTKKSLIYWKILLSFIIVHYKNEFPKYLSLAKSNCEDFENLPKELIVSNNDDQSHSWLDSF